MHQSRVLAGQKVTVNTVQSAFLPVHTFGIPDLELTSKESTNSCEQAYSTCLLPNFCTKLSWSTLNFPSHCKPKDEKVGVLLSALFLFFPYFLFFFFLHETLSSNATLSRTHREHTISFYFRHASFISFVFFFFFFPFFFFWSSILSRITVKVYYIQTHELLYLRLSKGSFFFPFLPANFCFNYFIQI